MKKIIVTVLTVFSFTACFAQNDFLKNTELIDIPTTEVLDHYSSQFSTRFYSEGSVMETIDFGVYPRVNLGVSIAVQNIIGSDVHMKVLNPAFQFKYRVYDGSLYLPSFAIGYDGRKYGYDREEDDYHYDAKGGYIVMGREVIIPNLQFLAGANLSDFDKSDVYFFTGASFNIEDKVNLMVEWDRVHTLDTSSLNAAVRLYLTDSFHLDLAARDMVHKNYFERVAQLRYFVNF